MAQHIEINADLAVDMGRPDGDSLAALWRDGFAAVIDLRVSGEAAQALPPDGS